MAQSREGKEQAWCQATTAPKTRNYLIYLKLGGLEGKNFHPLIGQPDSTPSEICMDGLNDRANAKKE